MIPSIGPNSSFQPPVRGAVASEAPTGDGVTLGATPKDDAWASMGALRATAAATRAGAPVVGWMRGRVDGAAVDVTFDRRAQTIRGSAFGQPVRVDVNDEQQTVTGEAGGAPLALQRTWTPEAVGLDGTWRGSDFRMGVDWTQGTARGEAGGRAIDLRFDLQQGHLAGTFAGAPVSLEHDATSGHLRGTLAGRQAAIDITNRDLSDFIQNIYLFVR